MCRLVPILMICRRIIVIADYSMAVIFALFCRCASFTMSADECSQLSSIGVYAQSEHIVDGKYPENFFLISVTIGKR
ncbi:unnamed protein product [Nippostrongylus brasiliensis]|uniref:Secreted protein n=1 Tax=Nippostrongylus brasiliensis TaxID=27835 RepID=A0A0N4YXT5_NIPBR|nr:unnamed protein product [Nippostrongylus brasiliensis]